MSRHGTVNGTTAISGHIVISMIERSLVFGVPIGVLLGNSLGWRAHFSLSVV